MTDDDQGSLWADTKPPYGFPTLASMRKQKRHGLKAVSTFSGGGGSSLGLTAAGWTIPYAVEFIPQARETYMANFPTTHVDGRDIREIQATEILDHLGIERGQLDLFEGSPPCSSFSMANTSTRGSDKPKLYSDGVKQRTDDLFGEWLRLVEGLNAKAIIAENVPGMVMGDNAYGTFAWVCSTLSELGYDVATKILTASHYGSATSRRRLIFIGYRKDLGVQPRHPVAHSVRYSYREAMDAWPNGPLPEDELIHADIKKYSIYPRWVKLKPGEQDEDRFNLIRLDPDKPVPTLTSAGHNSGAASVTHCDEPRKLTATEAGWCTGYPSDYTNLGDPRQRYERIARAVPPPMYLACGSLIRDELLAVR